MLLPDAESGTIDLIAKFFDKEQAIFTYVKDRVTAYFKSGCFDGAKKRRERLLDSFNMKIGSGNWKSKISLPIVKEQQRIIRAVTASSFRADPIYSLEPINDTSYENAVNMSQVCMMNLKHTLWRPSTFRTLINNASIVGTSVQYAHYHEEETRLKRTVNGNFGMSQRVEVPQTIQQVRHSVIDMLNYFQDPSCIDPDESDYQGHLDQVSLSELKRLARFEKDNYILKNLQEIIKDMEESKTVKDPNRHTDNVADRDSQRFITDRIHYWGKINIDGNEGDGTIYYIQIIGDKIIRFQSDVYDMGLKPYSIFSYEKRYDYWWGNAEAEGLLPHENYMNLLLSITADSALESTQRLKLYQKGQLDPSDINNRAINNGFVPVELLSGQRLQDVVFELQSNEKSLNGVDFMLKEMKESAQRMSTRPDFQRTAANGGPANTTATAAGMMQGESNTLQSDFLESFSYGLCSQARADSIILMQMLDGEIKVRPDIKQTSRVLQKPEILGDYHYTVKTSFSKNNILEVQKMFQTISQIMQMKLAGLPSAQNINETKLMRAWLKASDLGEDIDEIYPEQSQQMVPGAMPSQLPEQAQMAAMAGAQGGF